MGGNYYRAMCIEPVTDPKSLNYIYESTSNEMILVYEFVRGIQSGFRIKFSSGKPSGKKTFENITMNWNIKIISKVICHLFKIL